MHYNDYVTLLSVVVFTSKPNECIKGLVKTKTTTYSRRIYTTQYWPWPKVTTLNRWNRRSTTQQPPWWQQTHYWDRTTRHNLWPFVTAPTYWGDKTGISTRRPWWRPALHRTTTSNTSTGLSVHKSLKAMISVMVVAIIVLLL